MCFYLKNKKESRHKKEHTIYTIGIMVTIEVKRGHNDGKRLENTE